MSSEQLAADQHLLGAVRAEMGVSVEQRHLQLWGHKRPERVPPTSHPGGQQPTPREAGPARVGSRCRSSAATSLSLGCLLDFLKTDEGSQLSLSRLIDMSAQVCERQVR